MESIRSSRVNHRIRTLLAALAIAALGTVAPGCSDPETQEAINEAKEGLSTAERELQKGLDDAEKEVQSKQAKKQLEEAREQADEQLKEAQKKLEEQSKGGY